MLSYSSVFSVPCQTTILDGRDGTLLISPALQDSVGSQASPIVVSVEGYGNDIFLHWVADCLGHEGKGGEYTFVKGKSTVCL